MCSKRNLVRNVQHGLYLHLRHGTVVGCTAVSTSCLQMGSHACCDAAYDMLVIAVAVQDKGLALHLRKAALHWRSDAPASTLWSTLLLHDLALAPGTRVLPGVARPCCLLVLVLMHMCET